MKPIPIQRVDRKAAGKPRPIPTHKTHELKRLMRERGLHTVCESARCPNIGECWAQQTATFQILGEVCTRNCAFCSVATGRPKPPDPGESKRLAQAARELGLRFVVVTSVDRDDLPDEGASAFVLAIRALREEIPGVLVEVLTPDFKRNPEAALQTLAQEPPEVFGHNLETVERLQREVRPGAGYQTSLDLLRRAGKLPVLLKSGLMVGLGETEDEAVRAAADLAAAGVRLLTIGQYLRPTRQQHPVEKYYTEEEFERLAARCRQAGIPHVIAGPFVRSSYHAHQGYLETRV